jgi:hypothetical protein
VDAEIATGRIPDGTQLYLADGGLETTMIGERGFELPEFASFVMLGDPAGRDALRAYYRDYIGIARAAETGFTLDTPTWRWRSAPPRRARRPRSPSAAQSVPRATPITPRRCSPRPKRRRTTQTRSGPSPPPESTWSAP